MNAYIALMPEDFEQEKYKQVKCNDLLLTTLQTTPSAYKRGFRIKLEVKTDYAVFYK